ncbi:class I SAM-dependent methyltransferase [Paenibacillus sp.]|uniref:class I SAM-dependent methyltransferase n=1 Tax=Paenibacillus sp. TaxID=58172 RepID=UPI002D2BF8B6|nr:SAM-dependent methyltransferase [Paenibacillus sp.]HZG55898.1 SAM-dependent methyltransferase [Paenibacillus sp.]
MTEVRNRAVEAAVARRLRERGGRMTFAAYMQLCLYEPGIGYYQRGETKLGKAGDFYTSAHIGNVMGGCIASRLDAAARRTAPAGERIAIVEWGGGDGRLACAVLDELRQAFPDTYARMAFLAVEGSPHHRRLQRERLASHAERIAGVCDPGDAQVERTLREETTLLFANELLDAFPVHRIVRLGGEWYEIYVERDEASGALREAVGPIEDEAVAERLTSARIEAAEGQRLEVGLAGLRWLERLGATMRRGFALLADYGDVSAELYGPHRMAGTLLTYRGHTASDDALQRPGAQDITAHVNFEWCAEAAEAAGFADVRVVTQKQFLVDEGVLNKLQNHAGRDPFSPEARANRAIRQLLISDGMSELFKVMTMEKTDGAPA